MLTQLRSSLTYANVTATVALFIALGGTSYAVATGSIDSREIKNNTVGSKDLRNNNVRGKDIRNGTLGSLDVRNGGLLAEDFKAGELPAGERGGTGEQGPPGQDPTNLFAYVNSEGTIAFQRGVTAIAPHTPGSGSYGLTFNRSLAGCAVLTSAGRGFPSSAANLTQGGAEANASVALGSGPDQVQISTFAANTTTADRGFSSQRSVDGSAGLVANSASNVPVLTSPPREQVARAPGYGCGPNPGLA